MVKTIFHNLFVCLFRRCPRLLDLAGWIVMLKAVNTNSNILEMISGKPILTGSELHVRVILFSKLMWTCI